jgi:hypothetical protein
MIQGIANLQLIVGLLMVIQNLEILMILYFKILQPIQQEILRLKQQIKDQNKPEITRLQIWFNWMQCLHNLHHLQLWLYMTNLINSKEQPAFSNNLL